MDNLIPVDKEEAIKSDIADLEKKVTAIVVTDDESAQGASEFLGQIKARLKRLKELRTELTRPFKDAVKNADNWFKTQESPLTMMEATLKQAIGKYIEKKQEAAEAERRKAEAEQRKIEDEAKKKAEAAEKKGEEPPEPPPAPIEPMEKPKSNIQTETGNVTTSKIWTWEVSNEARVLRKFMKVNDAEITKAVRSGERKIQGVKIFQKTSVSVR